MHSKWLGRVGLMALVTGVVGGSSGMMGCAAERDPINRVQGNALPKSFFIGNDFQSPKDDPEFIARTMVIDVPYGESGSDFLMFTNTVNQVAKIKWEIEEKYLVGRISFERVDGTDGKGLPPKTASDRDPNVPLAHNNGIPVYQFAITSQFDIRRAYNSQTGEESNVVEENSSDRRWQDREYIRVDFSQNLNTTSYDFDTLALLGVYNGIEYTSRAFDIQDPNDKNAPVIDAENGYFDVTNKVFAQPKMLDLGGWVIPGCMLPNIIGGGTEPYGNCNANELTLRHSFRRVVNTDYEPANWDGQRFETYGAFHNDRNGYARDYGLADAKWVRNINRYNIWERSHYYKDLEKMEGAKSCTTDAQCSDVGAVPGMSHCDTFNQKCSLPFKERVAKPIAWHYSDGSPELYFDATREAAEEWDAAMRVAVNSAKYGECQRFTPDEDCASKYPIPTGNFAEEEDLIYLVKEVNACRRDAYEKGTDAKACDALADQIGEARGYTATVREIAKQPEMVVVCHSPVTKGDLGFKDSKGNSICGKEGTVARLGDLRFHLLTNVATPQTNSPWGIMSDSNDPQTGEHIAASINVWTHVNDLFARGLVDTLRYIGGELKTEDITDGKYVNQWVEAARQSSGTGLTPVMNGEEIDKRVAAAAGTTVEKMRDVEAKYGKFATKANYGPNAQLKKALVQNLKKISQMKGSLDGPSVNAPIYEARMNMLRGTPEEAAIVTPAMQQLAKSALGDVAVQGTITANGGSDPSSAAYKAASALQGLNPTLRRNLYQKLELGLAQRDSCIMHYEATAPLGYVALGDILQQKFGKFNPAEPVDEQVKRADRMKDWIRRRAQYAVIAHEMGHSIGLRHNFVSSSDAWNFRWQYWALRTNAKKVTTECDEQSAGDGKNCVGPRWLDKVTPNESKNMIQMWAHSSTMEYPGEPSQDLLGIDRYDFGAARMFYGDTVTVYSDSKFNVKQVAGSFARDHQNEFGGLLGYRYGDFSSPIHYSHLDKEIGLITKCETVSDPQAFKPANWNEERDGAWNPIVDGHLVTNEDGKYVRCQEPNVDHVQWTAMKDDNDKTHAVDGKGRVRVPHGFASDEWADLGNVAVFRHDNGADLYETMHFMIAQQEMNHIFSSYRRGRRDFSIWGAFQRTLGRYHEKMRDAAKAIGLYITLAKDTVTLYNDGTDPAGFAAEILKQIAVDNTVASSIAFDHFAHVFARPQPGEHAKLGNEDGGAVSILRSLDGTGFASTGSGGPAGGAKVKVANGVTGGFGTISLGGRPIENALARDKGRDYDRDYTLNVGSYYEKAFTAMLFAESADNFISASRDDFVDPRFRAVSLADVFPDGFRRWLANNLTNDEVVKGVYVRPAGQGGGVQPPPGEADYVVLGQTSWWPSSGAEACFPQDDRITCRNPFDGTAPAATPTQVIDPQVGWEQQKFAALLSLVYINDNQRTQWMDQMRIYDLSLENDPGFENRIEFHDPFGHVLVAQTFGTEVLFGKTVQKGIAARVLEYANELLQKGVETEPVLRGTRTVGYRAKLDANGNVVIKGGAATCDHNRECLKMKNYVSLPRFLMQLGARFGWVQMGGLKGVY